MTKIASGATFRRVAATNIDEGDAADGADDDQRMGGSPERLRQQACPDVSQRRRDPAGGKRVTKPQQRAGDVASERAKRAFNVPVGAAAAGYATAAFGEADRNGANRERAQENDERRVRTAVGGECRRHDKD